MLAIDLDGSDSEDGDKIIEQNNKESLRSSVIQADENEEGFVDKIETVKERGSQRQTMKLQQSELSKHIEKQGYASKRLESVCINAILEKLSFFK